MKKNIFWIALLISITVNAQSFYATSSTAPDFDTATLKLTVANCDTAKIFSCNNSTGIALDTNNNIYSASGNGDIYKASITATTRQCHYLGSFNNPVIALVADVSGNLYAANENIIYKYDSQSQQFFIAGQMPVNFRASGDLFFYECRLFLTCGDGSNYFLVEVNVDNPSLSTYYMSLENKTAYGAFSLNSGNNSKAYILDIGATTTTAITNLYELNMQQRNVGPLICSYAEYITDAASNYRFSSSPNTTSLCAPLPVDILNFYCKVLNKQVELKWETGMEHNNNYFVIEKSMDGITFSEIGKRPGAINSNSIKTYSFIDYNVSKKAFYRLKQVDINGNSKYSKVLVAKNESSPPFNIIYRQGENTAEIFIDPIISGENCLTIFDISGNKQFTYSLQNNYNWINIEKLKHGIYILQINLSNGTVYIQRLIK